MNDRRLTLWFVIGLALLLALLTGIGIGRAQGPVPATERSGTEPFLAPELPEPSTPPSAPDADSNGASPSDPQSPNLSFSYYYVPGATLHSRDSATGHDYSSSGCVFTTSGTDRILNTELHVPDGSIIKYLRLYYDDTNATSNVSGYITRYDAGTGTNDLVSVSSSGSSGVGTNLSSEITHTVDNFGYAYVLIGWPGANSSTVKVCGLRVAYYAPINVATFLPVIRR